MRLAIVGAGKGGTNLIRIMKDLENAEIQMVVDRNIEAEGIRLAKEMGIPFASEIADIDSSKVDGIIEATGVPAVANALEEQFGGYCRIIDSQVALLMMSIVDKQVEMTDKLNDQVEIIQKTSDVFANQFKHISESIDTMQNVSDSLLKAIENSNQYINQSDETIKAVNKIANQIKILGLNANIEAARAGEQGRGFAVVANEVQKLSDSSTQFAMEISSLLKSLSSEIDQVNAEVDRIRDISNQQATTSKDVEVVLTELQEQSMSVG